LRGGNTKVDKIEFNEIKPGSNLRGLRPTLYTYEGDDSVTISTSAQNIGDQYSVPDSSNAIAGKQRSVGLFQVIVDLGKGGDNLDLDSEASFDENSEPAKGASSITNSDDFFGGIATTSNDEAAAASLDIYESVVFAGSGHDQIDFYNGWESDVFLDGGNDILSLTAGRNLFVHGGPGSDIVTFEDDEVSYEGTQNGYFLFDTTEGSVFIGLDVERVIIGDENVNLFEGFGGILGTRGDDDIKGTKKGDLIDAIGGNDYVKGVGGNDIIYGFDGNDTISGGAGSDELYGDNGKDQLYGGKGNDFITGKSGNDKLVGDNGNDTLLGNNGNDTIDGGNGKDYIKGGDGKDVVRGGKGKDTFALYEGKDRIKVYEAGEPVILPEQFLGSGIRYKNKKGNLLITTNGGINTTIDDITKKSFLSAIEIQIEPLSL
jgi:Ca2+-binding RTX toxin-like protein